MTSHENEVAARGWPYWTCYAATTASALVSLGYSALAVADGEVRSTNALYAASRSTAFAALAVSAPAWRRPGVLLAAAIAMTAVQALDAGIGLTLRNRTKTAGPALTAAATAVTIGLLAHDTRTS